MRAAKLAVLAGALAMCGAMPALEPWVVSDGFLADDETGRSLAEKRKSCNITNLPGDFRYEVRAPSHPSASERPSLALFDHTQPLGWSRRAESFARSRRRLTTAAIASAPRVCFAKPPCRRWPPRCTRTRRWPREWARSVCAGRGLERRRGASRLCELHRGHVDRQHHQSRPSDTLTPRCILPPVRCAVVPPASLADAGLKPACMAHNGGVLARLAEAVCGGDLRPVHPSYRGPWLLVCGVHSRGSACSSFYSALAVCVPLCAVYILRLQLRFALHSTSTRPSPCVCVCRIYIKALQLRFALLGPHRVCAVSILSLQLPFALLGPRLLDALAGKTLCGFLTWRVPSDGWHRSPTLTAADGGSMPGPAKHPSTSTHLSGTQEQSGTYVQPRPPSARRKQPYPELAQSA
eukprot:scaffold19757_cov113-Isochrysis_galbana.AAC.9